ncbi:MULTISPECIES: hypothetical protein [unclassified Mesorhizobium]|uniref:hypothetical protein n=1 Tax=unclassified Mesorhizobium TaxID=325217 RepID=UPI00067F6DDF|nr:hypothetical protein [Mesorhizobium sp. L2C054A000]
MTSGVFAVSRDIFEHHFFAAEPFTEREAWVWLIREAAWKARRVRVKDGMVALKRGQLASSVRFMADRWQWHRSSVDRFLKRLKTETMISISVETGQSVITICKYDTYQRVSLPAETASETPSETTARQPRDKQEDIKGIEGIKKKNNAPSAVVDKVPPQAVQPNPAENKNDREGGPDWHGSAEEKFYAALPGWQKAGVPRGMLFQIGEHLGGDFDQLIDIAGRAASAKKPKAYLGGVLKQYRPPAPAKVDPKLPAWITDARCQGYPVEREGTYWRFAGGLYDDTKQQVGN